MHDKIVRVQEVMMLTGLSKMSLYRLEKGGQFPARRKLSKRSIGWVNAEILNWLQTRPTLNSMQVEGETI